MECIQLQQFAGNHIFVKMRKKKNKQDGLTEASKCLKKMKESSTLHILIYLE